MGVNSNIAVGMEVLGYVGASFSSYDAALTAAKKLFPSADAVVVAKGTANDFLIPMGKHFGYYAVKFTKAEPAAPKKGPF